MNPVVGWALAALAFVAGWIGWGWRGLALAFTVTVFWLVLQFSRSLRVLRGAGANPVGHVPNAVMLHSRLHAGMTMLQVIGLTRSLGRRLAENPERWGWADPGGARVGLTFDGGKLQSWELTRDDAAPPARDAAPGGAPEGRT